MSLMNGGLTKPKQYAWQDSNLELFGSDTEIDLKKKAALTERSWDGILEITTDKVFVWRIEQFKVVAWPLRDYGKFFNGDSYIVLKITKENDMLQYDIHFWIGKYSSQDEYGTAAYKTVELDNYLDDKASQHREVQSNESDQFKSYFDVFSILKGGTNSGFRHVVPTENPTKLTEVSLIKDDKGHDKFQRREMKLKRENLEHGKTYILESESELVLWVGNKNNRCTWIKLMPLLKQIESDRNGRVKYRIVQEDHGDHEDDPFYKYFEDSDAPDSTIQSNNNSLNFNGHSSNMTNGTNHNSVAKPRLFKLSDSSGNLKFQMISENRILSKSELNEHDVYIVDSGKRIFVYIGLAASTREKKNAMSYAHNYLKTSKNPLVSITCLNANNKSCTEFHALFNTAQR